MKRSRADKSKILLACAAVLVAAWAVHYYTVTRLTRMTPLMLAARNGDVAGVERELRAGADPNRVWNEGGFRIHGTSRKGITPILFALQLAGPGNDSRGPVVKALLAAGADPCVSERGYGSALEIATSRRNPEVVRALWEGDRAGCLKAHSAGAVRAGYYELSIYPEDPDTWALVEYLIDRVAQPGEADHPGMLVAAQNPAARPALERLLARGVRADGESLTLAAIQGKAELIPVLVAHGADVNAHMPLDYSGHSGPPLIRALENPNVRGIRALLDAGADVNAVDKEGRTALSQLVCGTSCMNRPNPFCETQMETLRLLLERGARVAGTSRFGDDLATCLQRRPKDPYRADLESLLGVPATSPVVSQSAAGAVPE